MATEERNLIEAKKVCTACGRELSLSQFSLHPRSRDGRMAVCMDCRRRKLRGKGTESNPLEKFTARELMIELRKRGHKGQLTYTEVHRIEIDKL